MTEYNTSQEHAHDSTENISVPIKMELAIRNLMGSGRAPVMHANQMFSFYYVQTYRKHWH